MSSESQSNEARTPGREPVEKSDGVTDAEKYLAKLCEKNFLSLWSYPGVYRDQGKGQGKEICDLLVVFDQHVIIFSDKHCAFGGSEKLETDWQRWFRKAIQKSADQAWGAERWLRQHPKRVFLDRECKRPFPIDLPPTQTAVFHLIVVAHGVSSHITKFFSGGSGSLMLDTAIKGFDKHVEPFFVGDLDTQKTFIHVLDDHSLLTLMSTRDTISDFVRYLVKRAKLFRGDRRVISTGEEELLAIYLQNINENDERDFVFPIKSGQAVAKIYLPEGHWERLQNSPEWAAQISANKVSYAWDKLIERFSYYAMRGEQYFATDSSVRDTEKLLRFMAREPRWVRRYLAKAIVEMLQTTPVGHRRLRVLHPMHQGDPYYVFLLLPTHPNKTNEEYRSARRTFLQICCAVTKLENPQAMDIVGFATEPDIDRDSRSEDAVYFDGRAWTPEMESQARKDQKELRILTKAKFGETILEEYPSIMPLGFVPKNPRNKPCPCGSGKKYKYCCMGQRSSTPTGLG